MDPKSLIDAFDATTPPPVPRTFSIAELHHSSDDESSLEGKDGKDNSTSSGEATINPDSLSFQSWFEDDRNVMPSHHSVGLSLQCLAKAESKKAAVLESDQTNRLKNEIMDWEDKLDEVPDNNPKKRSRIETRIAELKRNVAMKNNIE